jgi:hypothetical protein
MVLECMSSVSVNCYLLLLSLILQTPRTHTPCTSTGSGKTTIVYLGTPGRDFLDAQTNHGFANMREDFKADLYQYHSSVTTREGFEVEGMPGSLVIGRPGQVLLYIYMVYVLCVYKSFIPTIHTTRFLSQDGFMCIQSILRAPDDCIGCVCAIHHVRGLVCE